MQRSKEGSITELGQATLSLLFTPASHCPSLVLSVLFCWWESLALSSFRGGSDEMKRRNPGGGEGPGLQQVQGAQPVVGERRKAVRGSLKLPPNHPFLRCQPQCSLSLGVWFLRGPGDREPTERSWGIDPVGASRVRPAPPPLSHRAGDPAPAPTPHSPLPSGKAD